MDLKKLGVNKFLQTCFAAAIFAVSFFAFSAHASAATQIFYSVGQNTTSHETGAGTVTVDATNRTATFSVAQTASNMGVGDLITYTGGSCYISSKTSTTVWGCQSATGGAPTAVTGADVTSIAHAFDSLGAAEDGAPTLLGTSDLVTGNYQLNFPCYYDSGADTIPVFIDDYTTGVLNYIKIYTPNNTSTEVNNSQRHLGKWDDGKYRLENSSNTLTVSDNYVRISGLQVKAYTGIYFDDSLSAGFGQVDSCIIKNYSPGSFHYGIVADSGDGFNIFNNVIHDFSYTSNVAIGIIAGNVYNNTIINSKTGISGNSAVLLRNNITQNCTDGFYGTFNISSDYNISDLASDAPGANSKNSTTVSFADAANKDFHLSISDTQAKNSGSDLSADSNFAFNTDIDGQTRVAPWDIGADQSPKNVYYSVGQSVADLKTGANPTVTITAGVAIFSEAQTGNIGVGDRVTYNTNQVAYISAKTDPDSAHWSLVTATGGIPGDISNSAVVSIKREFTSLAAATDPSVIGNSSHLNTADLVSANVVLNLPCYYDTGADTTDVMVFGYTTAANNYIKIYTPSNTSTEANNSQRHSGKWDDGKYAIVSVNPIGTTIPYVYIDGLQLWQNFDQALVGALLAGGNNTLNNSIIRGFGTYSSRSASGIYTSSNSNTVVNNIIYDYNNIINLADIVVGGGSNNYIYNNTISNSKYGIKNIGTSTVLINNLVQTTNNSYINTGTINASSTNNLSSDATALGSNPKINQVVQFADSTNKNFHLSISDTQAKNSGSDLSADPNFAFNTDIDGQTRSATPGWDIGADEAATAIFYSVGQNTTSNETGSGTVTVDATARTATFSVAQTATNVGVGDLITYAGGSCYISSKTSTSVWGCQSATGGAPTAATDADVTSIAHAFNSLSAAEAGATGASYLNTPDLVTGNYQLNFPCYYDSGADTTAVTVDGYTTSVSNYIKIYTPNNLTTEVNQSQRHSGKWDDGKYNLTISNGHVLSLAVNYIWVDGLQANANASNEAFAYNGIGSQAIAGTVSEQKISDNIVRINNNGSAIYTSWSNLTDGHVTKVWNNIMIGESSLKNSIGLGHQDIYDVLIASNNTAYNLDICYHLGYPSTTFVAKNNIAQNCTEDFYGSSGGVFDASSTNNISQDATSPNAAFRNKTVSFADAANKDFHLSISDIAAKNAGADLSGDANFAFNTDIDGQIRNATVNAWDIGADEGATAIYRSTGFGKTSALATGAANALSISSSTATFGSALAANIGVGDAIQYDSDNNGSIDAIAFIHGRTSSTVYTVAKADGSAPTATSAADSDWSIFRAYTTWSNAESGSENTGINAGVRNFDTWSGGADLATNNWQWNIACYNDAVETNYLDILGWKTAPANYLRVYAPAEGSEVGTSQRHSGTPGSGFRLIRVSSYYDGIFIESNDIRLEYLEISNQATTGGAASGIDMYSTNLTKPNILINGNLIHDNHGASAGNTNYGIYAGFFTGPGNVRITNNIVYGNEAGGIVLNGGYPSVPMYVYNNTVYGNGGYGINNYFGAGGNLNIKNNIASNNTLGDYRNNFGTSTNNLSFDATSPNVALRNKTVSFVDAANKDFHLASNDTAAKKAGVNLQNDPFLHFGEDIDGQGRAGNWDIGADEFRETQINSATGVQTFASPEASRGNTNGLVGYWSFDGPTISGGAVADLSGQNNSGTITGAVPEIGKLGQGMGFDGTSAHISQSSAINGVKTISLWIKASNAVSKKILNVDGTKQLETDGSGNVVATSFPSATVYIDGAVASAVNTEWHFVTIVEEAGVDFTSMDIGAVASSYFGGYIDEVRIYNRALSAEEVGELYKTGTVQIRK